MLQQNNYEISLLGDGKPITPYLYHGFFCYQIKKDTKYMLCLGNNTNKIVLATLILNEQTNIMSAREDGCLIRPTSIQQVPIDSSSILHNRVGYIKCMFFNQVLIPTLNGVLWQSANNSGTLPCEALSNAIETKKEPVYSQIPCAVIETYYGHSKADIKRHVDSIYPRAQHCLK